MSIPKGAIWQDLRGSFLSTVPPGTRPNYTRPRTLREWRRTGFYSVIAVTPKRFELIASMGDLDAVILTETEHFLDHAAEHQVTLWRQVHQNDWSSSAWLVVTAYYWAFYSGLALSRLLGDSVVFLDEEAVDAFKRLSGTQSKAPGAGAFRLRSGEPLNATERQLSFAKASGRVHDLLWRVLFERFEAGQKTPQAERANQLEYRLYSGFASAVKRLRAEWPSAVRNAVNYRPGYGYDEVRQFLRLEAAGYLRRPRRYSIDDVVGRFEAELASADMDGTPLPLTRMLLMLSILLHAISVEAHAELIDRNGLDGRWKQARRRFIERHLANDGDTVWPWATEIL